MKIQFIAMGKTSEKYLESGINIYLKRLNHYCNFEMIEIPDLKNTKNLSQLQIKEAEGDLILKYIENGSKNILLDENGKTFRSIEFAKHIEKIQNQGYKTINFIVGGPYGFAQKIHALADEKISLSSMTFSHQMIRLIFTEQLYRAYSILKNEPYHHE